MGVGSKVNIIYLGKRGGGSHFAFGIAENLEKENVKIIISAKNTSRLPEQYEICKIENN